MVLADIELKITRDVVETFLKERKPSPRNILCRRYRTSQAFHRLTDSGILMNMSSNTPTVDEMYLPRALAFHYCGEPKTTELARQSAITVVRALQELFDREIDKREFNFQDLEAYANTFQPPPDPRTIWLGLYLARELGFLSAWPSGNVIETQTFQIAERIVEINNLDTVWDDFVARCTASYYQTTIVGHDEPSEDLSTRLDPLLNIPDKGSFNRDFEELCNRASTQNPASIILADVDHFKNVNDSYGYQTGDQVLKEVAQTLSSVCANKGILYRWGGEEFAILLDNYSLGEAEALAERMRSRLAGTTRNSDPRTITASFGVSCCPEVVRQPADLFKSANDAIQAAKRNGRNQVRTSTSQTTAAKQTLLTQHALSIFMRTDESVRKLDEEIATSSGQPFDRTTDASFNVIEKAKALQISTVEEIADFIRKSSDTIRKIARCFVHTTPVPVGYSVSVALDTIAARRGRSAAHSYFQSLKLTTTSSGYIEELIETLGLVEGVRN